MIDIRVHTPSSLAITPAVLIFVSVFVLSDTVDYIELRGQCRANSFADFLAYRDGSDSG